MGPRLPTLAVAEARSYPPYRGLLGIEPKQPNPPKETASAAGLPTPAHRRPPARPPLPPKCRKLGWGLDVQRGP